MLKRLTGWLLMLAILSANYSYLFVYAGFKLNQKYIAAALCENRDKPWMHCNGHCYLSKKIKQAEEKEQAQERQTQKNGIQETFCETSNAVKFHTVLLQTISTPYCAPVPSSLNRSLFRPPQLG
ncbi:hypothetical protein KXQ82_06750 [Mucilaginibacter sp. HMF5004]|uniref:hypothetical protein n=1 Tax=Mucilaginibacter rivuli TaxID=2857527 RepID=UPI001C5FCCF3|nr:hypothetical protein [Mucilaginibacter rivuli]MBW4889405.1 hypothetical protein [Mucilaginibacter rivuli]